MTPGRLLIRQSAAAARAVGQQESRWHDCTNPHRRRRPLPTPSCCKPNLSRSITRVETAQDGFEALRLAHSWQPDLILLDVMMPGMDGYQTCRRLKSDNMTTHIPVVMVTALGDPSGTPARPRRRSGRFPDQAAGIRHPACPGARARAAQTAAGRMARPGRDRRRHFGLSSGPRTEFSVAGARCLVVDDWDLGARSTLKRPCRARASSPPAPVPRPRRSPCRTASAST